MKKLMVGMVAFVAMTLFGAQNAVSLKIAETYKGKTAVITGAASGMGLCTARALAAAGATVFMVDINAEGVKKEADAINALGKGKAYAVVTETRRKSSTSSSSWRRTAVRPLRARPTSSTVADSPWDASRRRAASSKPRRRSEFTYCNRRI